MSDAIVKQLAIRVAALERRLKRLEVQRPSWQNWTPTVTQAGSTIASTIVYARYMVIGQVVLVEVLVTVTGTGTAGNEISIESIPSVITIANAGNGGDIKGAAIITDAGTAQYLAAVHAFNGTRLSFFASQADGGGRVGANPSFALANNDRIRFNAVWER